MIPVAISISDWNRKEIIYACPKCKTDFRIFGDYEKFCHNCGTKIDWEHTPRLLSESISEEMEEEFIAKWNKALRRV